MAALPTEPPSRSHFKASFDEALVVMFGSPSRPIGRVRAMHPARLVREAMEALEFYVPKYDIDCEEAPVCDIGDVWDVAGEGRGLSLVSEVVGKVVRLGKVPLMVGGDHVYTYAALRSVKPDVVIVYDAHLDMRDEFLGSRLNYATFMRRYAETSDSELVYVGVRAFTKEELGAAKRLGATMLSASLVREDQSAVIEKLKEACRGRRAYVSVDVDVFDPAYAPTVSSPEPGGISPWEFFETLAAVEVVAGMDVMEVCSESIDPTCFLAGRAILEMVAVAWKRALNGRGQVFSECL